MPKSRCKICRGAVCSPSRSPTRNPGPSTSGKQALYWPPQPQEVDPAFIVSYQKQEFQDRDTIRSVLMEGRSLQYEAYGRPQCRGIAPMAPMGSRVTPVRPPQLPFSVGSACSPLPSSAPIPPVQLVPAAPMTQGGWPYHIESSARRNSVTEPTPTTSGRGIQPDGAIGTHFSARQAPAR
ncbi:uncharacterized protein EI90DRAFT_3041986 [Cantharellus anzutake]|uniref:uncharacterized protein n=1 Tax=Cantharellus anzutake TaxID=1750568 RepID=UPI001908D8F0|nr:uncharacterized protein EI90DRAFT_3041986 [Cantharellus anzutake]KAF8338187.1 hypothetical protein EI90DRAFT_3041986 [Cantharellus anzutake]